MSDDNVKVVIRCRPFNEKERVEGAHNVVHANHERAQVTVDPPDLEEQTAREKRGETIMNKRVPRTFTFDAVYGEESKNIDLFLGSFRPMVQAVTEGFNVCIFAYGQTGSGKSFTMENFGNPSNPGCIPNSFSFIFDYMSRQPDSVEFLLKASYIEIYNEEIRDLVTNNSRLPIKENKQKGVYIVGLSEHVCKNEADLQKLMNAGHNNRHVAATKMNAVSSRSHSIFIIRLEQAEAIDGKDHIKVGLLNMVDLAGSERQSKTGAEGQRLKEAAAINLSLSTLGIVIQKLVDGAGHIPYRESTLTRLLQNSLGGNSKTLMMAAINPASTNFEETMSTLRYADQAKRIKNKPKVNEDPKDAQIREMRDRIKLLEQQLQQAMSGGSIAGANLQAAKAVMDNLKAAQAAPQQEINEIEEIEEIEDPEEQKKKAELQKQKQEISNKLEAQKQKEQENAKAFEELKQQLAELKNATMSSAELEDENREKERKLRETRIKLAERQERELLLKRQLEIEQEEREKANKTYNDAKEEVEAIQEQINKVKERIAGYNQDLTQIRQELQNKLDDMDNQFIETNKQLALRELIAQMFIPPFELAKAERNLYFDEEDQQWKFGRPGAVAQLVSDARDIRVRYPRGNNAPEAVGDSQGTFIKKQQKHVMEQPDQLTVK